MKRFFSLLSVLLFASCFTLFAESIDDIFDVAKTSSKMQLVSFLERNGFERYNLEETNGNLYFQPKQNKNITFYGMKMNAVIFGYYNNNDSLTMLTVSVKSKENVVNARKAKNLIIDKYGFEYSTNSNAFKKGNYSFSTNEYIDDEYGYINFCFGNWKF